MQLHELQPAKKRKTGKRVGRGGKRGTYSGRGMKGQKSRSGARFQPLVPQIIKRYPKLRGYRVSPEKREMVVNVGQLAGRFSARETVTPEGLLQKGLVDRIKGRAPAVKLLGDGELSFPLTIEGCSVSKTARDKIEKAGGQVHKESIANRQ